MKHPQPSFSFVFSFIGECCPNAHLYAISKRGPSRRAALQAAKEELRKQGKDVYEVVEVPGIIGAVEEA